MRERIVYGVGGEHIARYVNGELVYWRDEKPREFNGNRQHVMGDIKPYISQLDGTIITSRSRHREHLRAHNCVEVGNDSSVLNPKQMPMRSPPGLKDRLGDSYRQVMERKRR